MKNQCFANSQGVARDIFGDDIPAQKIARDAFPILVSHAQNCSVILMSELANEVVPHLTQFNLTMGWAFAWIQNTLYNLEREDDWNYGGIPEITTIVLVEPERPTNWMVKETRSDPNTPFSWSEYEKDHIQPVFKYRHWDKVLDYVKGKINV